MGIYKCFNCPYDGGAFDCKEAGSYRPYVGLKGNKLTIAISDKLDTVKTEAHWLLDLLRDPSLMEDGGGYIIKGVPDLPRCPGCKKFFMANSSRRPHFLMCGHLICDGCMANNEKKNCHTCDAFYGDDANPESTILLDFLAALFAEMPIEFSRVLVEDEKTHGEPEITSRQCADCNISIPISALIHCNDCSLATCGGCYLKKHKGHDGVELLGIELSALQDRASTHILGVFEGYDKNFQHLHASIRDGMAAMTKAGADKLKEINDKGHYDEGKAVADEMTALSADFEKQCEEYMPVARKFNDHLISYKERIEKKE